MRHRRIPNRRVILAGAGAAALVAAAIVLPNAEAANTSSATPAPAPAGLTAVAAQTLASNLAHRLGGSAAGSYFDAQAKRLVVNITDPADAAMVRAAGAVPKTVEHSMAQLRSATATLAQQARIPGTAWAIDPRADQVVVTADTTVTGTKLARLDKAMGVLGSMATMRHSKGQFKPFVAGGDAIWGSDVRCSLGFNVTKGGAPYFLTAGHCGNAASSWSDSQGGSEVGQTVDSQFPGTDFALVKYDDANANPPSAVDLYSGSQQQITHAADATVGEQVQRSGSTSQVHGGQVTGLNATVNYSEGTVNGLIQTNVCAEPGDSGGALFDGDAAIGLTSGGDGDCTSGGTTYFQPVTAALSAEGATIP
ncbi:S1 family peptidase [Streptomyces sp. RB6PN25]|uniref:S1 family peptidase n=1 Tax=Streptomyces humicola TaxID=2953240 RepID=A0ABT1Q011_9ACTN|nr:S1 family peptidase [Streptomyces humicola]MCQ4083263.1 S1 family peptidase [Streptomyces humicola]